jgi:hypothetical protein
MKIVVAPDARRDLEGQLDYLIDHNAASAARPILHVIPAKAGTQPSVRAWTDKVNCNVEQPRVMLCTI